MVVKAKEHVFIGYRPNKRMTLIPFDDLQETRTQFVLSAVGLCQISEL